MSNDAFFVFGSGAKHFGIADSVDVEISKFACGESKVRFKDSVRKKEVIIVQSFFQQKTNDQLMELLLLIDAAKRAGASEVVACLTYFPYARQDRKPDGGSPISARVICDVLKSVGVKRIVAIDLHATQIQGFVSNGVLFDHVYSAAFIAYHLKKTLKKGNLIVCSPDAGGVKRAKELKTLLDIREFCMIDKTREEPNQVQSMTVIGSVKGKDVLIVDDLIDTAGTLVKAAECLKEKGANSVMAVATHPVFSPPAYERVKEMKIFVTNSIEVENPPANITVFNMQMFLLTLLLKIKNKDRLSDLFYRWEE